MSQQYDLGKLRKQLKSKEGRQKDQNEFTPKKAESASDAIKYRFYVLPPLQEGDRVAGGKASRSMDSFAVQYGMHWHQKRPYACPRLFDETECPVCQAGFDIAKDETDKKVRSEIFRRWLPNPSYYMNIYFPDGEDNPQELCGKVMYYAAPKTVYDIMYAAVFRDTYGDPREPEGFGCFFDPNAALLFSLNVKKASGSSDDGRSYNDYKSSKFIVSVDQKTKEALLAPIANSDHIQAILDKRHDIYSRLDVPDAEKINKLCQTMLNSAGGGGFDHDEGESEQKQEPKSEPKNEQRQSAPAVHTPASEPVSTPVAEEKSPAATAAPAASKNDQSIEDILARLRAGS